MLFATAIESSTAIVAYLALFTAIGFAFIFVNLLVGRFVRPDDPHEEKREIYECGEPAIGSSFVQFDLRFYVVALVFIIFDVEVAFLFPWATVYGKAANLMHANVVEFQDGVPTVVSSVAHTYRELGVRNPVVTSPEIVLEGAAQLATLALVAGLIFFAVLFVGFAYEWKTGALDWVRAIRAQHDLARRDKFQRGGKSTPQESVLSA
jgi:NADH-quinone oxidoreductase subunit A